MVNRKELADSQQFRRSASHRVTGYPLGIVGNTYGVVCGSVKSHCCACGVRSVARRSIVARNIVTHSVPALRLRKIVSCIVGADGWMFWIYACINTEHQDIASCITQSPHCWRIYGTHAPLHSVYRTRSIFLYQSSPIFNLVARSIKVDIGNIIKTSNLTDNITTNFCIHNICNPVAFHRLNRIGICHHQRLYLLHKLCIRPFVVAFQQSRYTLYASIEVSVIIVELHR